ncbi:MAG TPA: tetratricopeptide repeat protein [Candidatus Acidoferrum sp.]|nr:tetratricopeptide repeat protein [Candidatus Acidoferrum sp.]
MQALQSHDNELALRLAQELAQAHPTDPRAWTLQGIALQGLGRTQESLRAFKHALQIDPNNVAALEAAAQLEFQAGSPKALPFLEKLLTLNPDDETAHAMTAALAFQRKDCASCVAHYQKSPQLVANDIPALSQLGACLVHLNRPEEALSAYQRIAELQPQDPEALYYLGLAQYGAHRYDDAIRVLLPLTEDGPDKQKAAALNLIAAAYENDQQTPAAVAALQKAIALDPANTDNYLDLATISLDHGAFKLGVDVLNAGIHALPDSERLYLERGVLEVQLQQFDEANADFRKAAALNPLQNYSSVALGISLLQENKPGESLRVVRLRLAKAPADPTLNYLLAELLIRKGAQPGTPSFQEAKAAAQRAVRSKPEFTLAQDVLTELYLRAGNTALAEATARLALQSDPNDQSALYHLIVCLRGRGEQTELPQLVQKLAEVTAGLREQEKAQNRFKLVEEESGRNSQKGVVP